MVALRSRPPERSPLLGGRVLIPRVVIITVSQKWPDEEFSRTILRRLHDSNPRAVLRFISGASGMQKRVREFAEILEFEIEEWKLQDGWYCSPDYRTEIRAQSMLNGLIRDPQAPWELLEQKPPADLVIALWGGNKDNCHAIWTRALVGAGRERRVVVYREKKGRIEQAVQKEGRTWKLDEFRPIPTALKEAA